MTKAQFTIERTGPNMLRMTVSGAMDAQSMEVALQRMSTEMAGMAHGNMLMVDQGADWPSPGAIAVELRHWPQMMAMLHQLDRMALVSHNTLFRTAAMIESALLPGFEIRTFTTEASALDWLNDVTEAAS